VRGAAKRCPWAEALHPPRLNRHSRTPTNSVSDNQMLVHFVIPVALAWQRTMSPKAQLHVAFSAPLACWFTPRTRGAKASDNQHSLPVNGGDSEEDDAVWHATLDCFLDRIESRPKDQMTIGPGTLDLEKKRPIYHRFYKSDPEEFYVQAKEDLSIGMITLAAASPSWKLRVLPLAILITQILLVIGLGLAELDALAQLPSWCPASAGTNERAIMAAVAMLYAVRSFLHFECFWRRVNPWAYQPDTAAGMVAGTRAFMASFTLNPGGCLFCNPLALWGDELVMNGAFLPVVYLLNLAVVFTTPDTIDMLFNMLALEFILDLDDQFKPVFMDIYKEELLPQMRELDRQVASERNLKLVHERVGDLLYLSSGLLQITGAAACVLVIGYGPLCK
jgi:hypothetical protein